MTLHKPLYWKLIILFKYMNFQNVYKITIRLLLRKNVHSTKIIIPWNRLPVSDLACKELKSCRLVLTTSIELGGKNEEPSQIYQRIEVSGQNMPPKLGTQTGTYRWSELTETEIPAGTRAEAGKPELWVIDYWRLSVDKFWEFTTPEGPSIGEALALFWVLPQEFY